MSNAAGPVILNVNDHEGARRGITRVLEAAGFRVQEAINGSQAISGARRNVSAVVLDVGLPDLDGLAVCQALREDRSTAAIPMLMVSASFTSADDHVRGLDAGADAYLAVPFDPEVLVAHLRALLRLRDAQRRTEGTLRRAFNAARMVGWSYAPAADRMERSDNAVDVIGFDPGTTAAEGWAIVHPDDLEAHQARVREALAERKPYKSAFRSRNPKNGEVRWLEDHGEGEWTESVLTRISGVLVDVTDRVHLEERLRQSQKMDAIGKLAGGIAHDFNNLLTIINGYGEVLHDDLPAEDRRRTMVEEIQAAGNRAAGLTRQLLTFSRQQVITPQVLDLNGVVVDAERMLRRLIGEDVELTLDLQPNVGNVKADRAQLEQVLLNLAVNARDAMPDGGRLTISTQRMIRHDDRGEYLLLSVADTGHGMSPEVKSRVFEPFFTTKERDKGTGLGLATAYGIIEQTGGWIDVESEPGAGAQFRVYLPRAFSRQHEPGPEPEPLATSPGKETILFVEDDDAVRHLTDAMLTQLGYRVLGAGDGPEAIRIANAHPGPIHLLLTDVVMPQMGGRMLSDQLHILRPGIKVVYVSGYMNDEIIRRGIQGDGVNFLPKPFTHHDLAQKIRAVLDGRR